MVSITRLILSILTILTFSLLTKSCDQSSSSEEDRGSLVTAEAPPEALPPEEEVAQVLGDDSATDSATTTGEIIADAPIGQQTVDFLLDFTLTHDQEFIPLQIATGEVLTTLPATYNEKPLTITLLPNSYLELTADRKLKIKSPLPSSAELSAAFNIEAEGSSKQVQLVFDLYRLKVEVSSESVTLGTATDLSLSLVHPTSGAEISTATPQVDFSLSFFAETIAGGKMVSGKLLRSVNLGKLGSGELSFSLNGFALHEKKTLSVSSDPNAYGAFSHYEVSTDSLQIGVCGFQSITVTAKDSEGRTVRNHNGDIHFVSSESSVNLPNSTTMLESDSGTKTFAGLEGFQPVKIADFTLSAQTSLVAVSSPDHINHSIGFTVSDTGVQGSGTEADPYYLCTASHWNSSSLAGSSTEVTSSFKLMQDMVGVQNITQIFSGVLDGNGFAIKDITVADASQTDYYALFKETRDAEIKNLKLTNISFSQVGSNSAVLIGLAQGTTLSGISGDGLTIQAAKAGSNSIGSLIGQAYNTNLTRIQLANVSVSLEENTDIIYAGGLIGQFLGGVVDRTSISGQFSAPNPGGFAYGGLIGRAISSTVVNSLVEVDITSSPNSTVNSGVSMVSRIGGLIGWGQQLSTIYASGYNGTMNLSKTTSADGISEVGGLVGMAHDGVHIFDSYSKGSLSIGGSAHSSSDLSSIGSLVGHAFLESFASSPAIIKRSYSTMNVDIVSNGTSNPAHNGLFIGRTKDGESEISDSFYAGTMTHTPSSTAFSCLTSLDSGTVSASGNFTLSGQSCDNTNGTPGQESAANLQTGGASTPVSTFDLWDDPTDSTADLTEGVDLDIWVLETSDYPKLWFEDLDSNSALGTHPLSSQTNDGLTANSAFEVDLTTDHVTLLLNPRFASHHLKLSLANSATYTSAGPILGSSYVGNPLLGSIDFSGLSISQDNASSFANTNGLFKFLPAGAKLANLTIDAIEVSSANTQSGILVGSTAADFENITISENSSIGSQNQSTGGFSATIFGGNPAFNDGDFTTHWFTGNHFDLKNITSYAGVAHTASVGSAVAIGGLAAQCDGINMDQVSILRDSNDGDNSDDFVLEYSPAGGVCGMVANRDVRMLNTRFTKDIRKLTTAGCSFVGGLSAGINPGGQASFLIEQSYTSGNFNIADCSNVGGLLGGDLANHTSVKNSYNAADVIGNESVGGLAGRSHNGKGIYENVYNSGNITGSDYVGGLVGSSNESRGSDSLEPEYRYVFSSGNVNATPQGSQRCGPLFGFELTSRDTKISSLSSNLYYSSTATIESCPDVAESDLFNGELSGGAISSSANLGKSDSSFPFFSQWSNEIWDLGADGQFPILRSFAE